MRASSCTPFKRLAFAVRYTTESSGPLSRGQRSSSTLCHGTPHHSSQNHRARSRGQTSRRWARSGGLFDVTLYARREARAGWPSPLALKPGERSRDRVRLTMFGRSTPFREAAFTHQPARQSSRRGSLRSAENRGDRWCRRHVTSTSRKFGRDARLLWVEQIPSSKIDEAGQIILVRRPRPKVFISSLVTIWVTHSPVPLACL